jgi:rhodanese-related sulfurtransferase
MDGEIDPATVAELCADDDPPHIVDIRTPAAFASGHIPDSLNIPLEELPNRVAELTDANRIVTVCPHGQASVRAARLISSYEGTSDCRVESMAGGLTAWEGPLADAAPAADTEGPEAPF